MKKRSFVLVLVLLLCTAVAVTACKKKPSEPGDSSAVAFAEKTVSVEVGAEKVLTVTGNTDGLAFESKTPTIVTVTADGKIKGIAEGTAEVTVTNTAGGSDSCTVTVTRPAAPVTTVTMNVAEYELAVGDTAPLRATVKVDGTTVTDKTVVWTSSDPTVATVDNGTVTALKAGLTTITATVDGVSATCALTVKNNVQIAFMQTTYKVMTGTSVEIPLTLTLNGTQTADLTGMTVSVVSGTATAAIGGSGVTVSATAGGKAVLRVAYDGETADVNIEAYRAVRNPQEFLAIADDLAGYYMLANDIDFEGVAYKRIAHFADTESGTQGFSGILDGNGCTVKNIDLSTCAAEAPYHNSFALFGTMAATGVVRNLNLVNIYSSTAISYSAAVVGVSYGTVENVYAEYAVKHTGNFPGTIVGQLKASGSVDRCVARILSTATTATKPFGGVVGKNEGHVANSYCINEAFEAADVAVTNQNVGAGAADEASAVFADLENFYTTADLTAFDAALWAFDTENKTAYPHLKGDDAAYIYFVKSTESIFFGDTFEPVYRQGGDTQGLTLDKQFDDTFFTSDTDGLHAIKSGSTQIVYSLKDGDTVVASATLAVTVKDKLEGSLTESEISMHVDDSRDLAEMVEITVNGAEGAYDVDYSVGYDWVESFEIENGVLYATAITVTPAEITIEVTTENGGALTLTLTVTVTDGIAVDTNLTEAVALDYLTSGTGDTFTLAPTVTKENDPNYNPTLTLEAETAGIVTIEGLTVTAAGKGETEIAVKIEGTTYATFTVEVTEWVAVDTVAKFFAIDDSLEALALNYKLTADLDFADWCAENYYTPIAVWGNSLETNGAWFSGVFDGDGHTLKNISNVRSSATASGDQYLGVFGKVSGTVKNFNVINMQMTAGNNCGTVAHITSGATLENIYVQAEAAHSGGVTSGGIIAQALSGQAHNETRVKNVVVDLGDSEITGTNFRVFVRYNAASKVVFENCHVISKNCNATATQNGTDTTTNAYVITNDCSAVADCADLGATLQDAKFDFMPRLVAMQASLWVDLNDETELPIRNYCPQVSVTAEVAPTDGFTVADGKITATVRDTATVTLSYTVNEIPYSVTLTVRVRDDVAGSFTETEKTISVGDTLDLDTLLQVTVNGETGAYSVTYSVGETWANAVEIDDGTLVANAITITPAEITAKITTENGGALTLTLTVTVTDGITVTLDNVDGTVALDCLTDGTADTFTVEATVTKKNDPGFAPTLTLEAETAGIVTIDGLTVTAAGKGETEIFVKIADTTYATFTVQVTEWVAVDTVAKFFAIDDSLESLALNYKLTADLDFADWCAENYYTPIAVWGNSLETNGAWFTGVFDGDGHTLKNISNVYNTALNANNNLGVFGKVSGTIKNFNVVNMTLTAGRYSGVVAHALIGATVENVYVQAHVTMTGDNNGGVVAQIQAGAGTPASHIRNVVVDLGDSPAPATANNFLAFVRYNASSKGIFENCHVLSKNLAGKSYLTANGTDTTQNAYVAFNDCSVVADCADLGATLQDAKFDFMPRLVATQAVLNIGMNTATPLPFKNYCPDVTVTAASDSDLFTVADGQVTATGTGEATVTLSYTVNEIPYSVTIRVVCAVSFEMDESDVTIVRADSKYAGTNTDFVFTPTATVSGEDATDQIEWTSSAPAVVTVADGRLTVVGTGEATITASLQGVTKSAKVSVYNPIYDTDSFFAMDASAQARTEWYMLVADIDFAEYCAANQYSPIGAWYTGTVAADYFSGVFDGNGFALKNISNMGNAKQSGAKQQLGVFGQLTGTVRNLNILNLDVNGIAFCGAVAHYVDGATIENVYIDATYTVSGNNNGGVFAQSNNGAAGKTVTVKNVILNIRSMTNTGTGTGWTPFTPVYGWRNHKTTIDNCYVISTYTEIPKANGCTLNNCLPFADLGALYAGDLTVFDDTLWTFDTANKTEQPRVNENLCNTAAYTPAGA